MSERRIARYAGVHERSRYRLRARTQPQKFSIHAGGNLGFHRTCAWGQHTSLLRLSPYLVHTAIPFPTPVQLSVRTHTSSWSCVQLGLKLGIEVGHICLLQHRADEVLIQTRHHDWGGAPYAPRGSLGLECMQFALERGALWRIWWRRRGIVLSSRTGTLGSSCPATPRVRMHGRRTCRSLCG